MFHYLLVEKQLCTLVLFELNILIKKFLIKFKGKSITHNIFRMPSYDSAMCGFYCIASTEYMTAG